MIGRGGSTASGGDHDAGICFGRVHSADGVAWLRLPDCAETRRANAGQREKSHDGRSRVGDIVYCPAYFGEFRTPVS